MKKIFTLIAATLMAVGAQAQTFAFSADDQHATEKVTLSDGDVPAYKNASGTAITSVEKVTMTIGSASDAVNKFYVKDGKGDLGENTILGTTYYISGTENPKTNGSTTKVGKVPETGTFYTFVLSEAGTLTVGINLGKGKTMRLANSTGAKVEEVAAPADQAVREAKDFALEAGTYYLYAEGSKLGLFGFKFVAGSAEEPDPTEQTAPQTWRFLNELSETDVTNIVADATNWTSDKSNNKYTCIPALAAAPAKAGENDIELLKGLNFTTKANKFNIYSGSRLNFGDAGLAIIVPTVVKNDLVTIEYASTNASEARGFVLPANAEVKDGNLTSTEKTTVTFKVKKSGSLDLYTSGGLNVYRMALNAELPEKTSGIATVKAAKANDAMFNVAGQKVAEGYKGLVIMNGKKYVK